MTVKAVRDVSAGALEGEAKLEQSLRPAARMRRMLVEVEASASISTCDPRK